MSSGFDEATYGPMNADAVLSDLRGVHEAVQLLMDARLYTEASSLRAIHRNLTAEFTRLRAIEDAAVFARGEVAAGRFTAFQFEQHVCATCSTPTRCTSRDKAECEWCQAPMRKDTP